MLIEHNQTNAYELHETNEQQKDFGTKAMTKNAPNAMRLGLAAIARKAPAPRVMKSETDTGKPDLPSDELYSPWNRADQNPFLL